MGSEVHSDIYYEQVGTRDGRARVARRGVRGGWLSERSQGVFAARRQRESVPFLLRLLLSHVLNASF